MQCRHCAYTTHDMFKFCPECGVPAGQATEREGAVEAGQADAALTVQKQDRAAAEQARLQTERLAYVRRDYDPCRDGRYPQAAYPARPCDPTVTPEPGYAVPAQTPGQSWTRPDAPTEQRPSTTVTIILAIVNMVGFGFGISLVLGLIALVLAILSSGESAAAEAGKKIGLARTLNIIGLAFIVLQVILIVLLVIGFVFVSQTGPLFSPENIPGDFPLG